MLISIATDTDSTPADYRGKRTFTSDTRGQLRVRKDYTWDTSYYGCWSLVSERRYRYDGMLLVQKRTASCATLCLGVEAVLNLLGTHIICSNAHQELLRGCNNGLDACRQCVEGILRACLKKGKEEETEE